MLFLLAPCLAAGAGVALRFLEAFAAGQPVGAILWHLRRHYLDTHHTILPFIYSLYCSGDVRIGDPQTGSGHSGRR